MLFFDALALMRDSLDPSRISEATQESSRMAQIAAGHLGL